MSIFSKIAECFLHYLKNCYDLAFQIKKSQYYFFSYFKKVADYPPHFQSWGGNFHPIHPSTGAPGYAVLLTFGFLIGLFIIHPSCAKNIEYEVVWNKCFVWF